MDNLHCDFCGAPCDAVLSEVGPVPSCCGERGVLLIKTDALYVVPDDPDELYAYTREILRPLTPSEEEELRRDLYAELEKSDTPHQRARRRSLDGY